MHLAYIVGRLSEKVLVARVQEDATDQVRHPGNNVGGRCAKGDAADRGGIYANKIHRVCKNQSAREVGIEGPIALGRISAAGCPLAVDPGQAAR